MILRNRTPAVPIGELPGTLPADKLPAEPDLEALRKVAEASLISTQAKSFASDAVWRDFLALTDSIRTLYGAALVSEIWAQRTEVLEVHDLQTGDVLVQRLAPGTAWVDVNFTFKIGGPLRRECAGTASLIYDAEDGWQIWMLRTWLEHFQGHHNPDTLHLAANGGPTKAVPKQRYDVSTVVIGGGQNGLSIAGRLQALGLSYVCLERDAEVGQNWTSRYEYMRWNTPKEFNNLPFRRTFQPDDPEWLNAKHIASAYCSYVEDYQINVWHSTKILDTQWSDTEKIWTLTIFREDHKVIITCRHLVLAIGQGQSVPSIPHWPHRDRYHGDVLHALETYKSARPWAGKRGIVVGTANTAMDIAQDMLDAGMSVTMLQRGKTLVIRSEWAAGAMKPLYNTDIPTENADRIGFTWPTKLIRELTDTHMHQLTASDSARFDALERAGFKVDRPGDLIGNLNERFGGYYFDFGACAKIEDGSIQVKSNASVKEYTEGGLRFDDGEELKTDVIVFATGFESDHRKQIANIVGQDIADKLDDYWGLDSEGELRGAYKPCGQENLWLMGGDTRQARWFSRFVALQIQASMLGHSMSPHLTGDFVSTLE